MGVADVNQSGTGVSMGAVWGDYDNDGYEDLFLIKWGKPELFHNDHGHGFTRVSEAAGLPPWINANTAVWFDYDGDGLLDLFVGGYYPEQLDLWHLHTTRMMPESFEYAKNGGRKFLFHNLGNGRFEEVSEKAGIRQHSLGPGRICRRLARHRPSRPLYCQRLRRLRTFPERRRTLPGSRPSDRRRLCPQERYERRLRRHSEPGQYAIYVSNISQEGVLIQGNNLWVPKEGPTLKYENLARDMGVELGGWSFGAQFGDLNNDGYLDLYLTNGYVSLSRTKSYWYDFSRVAGGNSKIIGDAANWPAFERAQSCPATSKRKYGSTMEPQNLSMLPRLWAQRTSTMAVPSRWRICGIAASSMWWSPTSADHC